jgi:U3 small nucleolar RNA-associated protein 13
VLLCALQVLLSASGDKTLKLWSLTDGTCLRTFEGHTAGVLRGMFVTAGTQVVSSGADGLVKLWSTRTAECVNTFDQHEDRVWALAAGGDQQQLLVSGGGDSSVVVWEDVTAEEAAAAAAEEVELEQKQQDLENALAVSGCSAAVKPEGQDSTPSDAKHTQKEWLLLLAAVKGFPHVHTACER